MTEETQKPKNPLLARVRLPGETHTLPSKGLFYKNGELADEAVNGEVHIFPMTTIDEITLRSSDLLFSGEAVQQIFERCIPQIKQPKRLLSKDVDFLLTVLRKISYGDQFEITYRHTCDNAKDHSYSIDISRILQQIKRMDPTTILNKFTVTLLNDQVVHFTPMRYEDVIAMLQINDSKKISTPEELSIQTAVYFSNMIEKVDETSDKEFIREWLTTIPAGWSKKFDDAIEATQNDWGVDFNVSILCKDCAKKDKISAPLNPLFFFI